MGFSVFCGFQVGNCPVSQDTHPVCCVRSLGVASVLAGLGRCCGFWWVSWVQGQENWGRRSPDPGFEGVVVGFVVFDDEVGSLEEIFLEPIEVGHGALLMVAIGTDFEPGITDLRDDFVEFAAVGDFDDDVVVEDD